MDKKLPKGKGLYVWNIIDMLDMWVDKFQDMGITWIAVKIADGVNSSNLRRLPDGSKVDTILRPFVKAGKSVGMMMFGWQYVYGFNPEDEAKKAAQRMELFELDGFIIDAEHQYYRKHAQAVAYSMRLEQLMPDVPIGLSTYRFPELHHTFPYKEFLAVCDFNAPQVYWNAGAAGKELRESYRQYELIKSLPFIPAGRSYYGEGFPKPTPAETTEFLTTAQELGCPAAFFWSADRLWSRTQLLPEIRRAIADYEWVRSGEPIPPVESPDEIPSGNYLMVDKLRVISIDNKIYENDNPIWLPKKE